MEELVAVVMLVAGMMLGISFEDECAVVVEEGVDHSGTMCRSQKDEDGTNQICSCRIAGLRGVDSNSLLLVLQHCYCCYDYNYYYRLTDPYDNLEGAVAAADATGCRDETVVGVLYRCDGYIELLPEEHGILMVVIDDDNDNHRVM